MYWKQMPLGSLQTNAYILSNQAQECLIIDPGAEGPKLIESLKSQNLRPLAILLTHAHFDHIGAINALRREWDVPVYLHENEKDWLSDPEQNGSAYFMLANPVTAKEPDELITEEGKLVIGSFEMDVFETPGHSPGSVSFYFPSEDVVFSGDALFSGSIGRTDLPGGNQAQLLTSIHSRLLSLPEQTRVASGHGPVTTIAAEMDSNPFLHGF